jgi:hypothetical protein
MRRSLRLSLLALATLSFASVASAQDFDDAGERAMLDRINAVRAEHDLAPVARLPELDAVARAHSAEMASTGALAHVSRNTGTPEDRVRNAGVEADAITENVAFHHDSAQAQQALLASPAHRGNILHADVTHVGLGAVRDERGVYVTQVFAEVAPEPAAAPAVAAPSPEPEPASEPAPAEDTGPVFELIPPFVERAADAAAQVVTPAAQMDEAAPEPEERAEASAAAQTAADGAEPAETTSADAPEAGGPEGTADDSATDAEASTDRATVTPATARTLRQLVGLAQSLLGAE